MSRRSSEFGALVGCGQVASGDEDHCRLVYGRHRAALGPRALDPDRPGRDPVFPVRPQGPVPTSVGPHLVVLVWNPPGHKSNGALTVAFTNVDQEANEGEPLARNVQPLEIEPGKFNYRLVRATLPFDDYKTILARCSIDGGDEHIVPYTLLPPVE